MTMLNFWLVALAALTTGAVTALAQNAYGLATVVALVGASTSLIFYGLDARTRALIQVAELALAHHENELADALGVDAYRLVAAADIVKTRFGSYRWLLGAFQLAVAGGYGGTLAYCAWQVFG